MPLYDYECPECGEIYEVHKSMSSSSEPESCDRCGRVMRKLVSVPAISGTRDSFGVGNGFVCKRTGKYIDTWQKWEQAGYRDAKDNDTLPACIKNEAKRKQEKIEKYDNKKRFSVTV